MSTQPKLPVGLQIWMAGAAAILVSGIALGALGMSSRGPGEGASAGPVAQDIAPPADAAPRGSRCGECGVIESTREGGFTVRLQDGRSMALVDTYASRWRAGERIMLIPGAK